MTNFQKGDLKWQRFAILTLGKNCSTYSTGICVASILLQNSGSPHFLRENRQKHLTNVYFDAFVMHFLRKVINSFLPNVGQQHNPS
jgi:hypothetical protein